MEVPRLGVKSELQPPAYTTAAATPDPSHICNLSCRLRQCWILNPLSEARDQTDILMDAMGVLNLLSPHGNSTICLSYTGLHFCLCLLCVFCAVLSYVYFPGSTAVVTMQSSFISTSIHLAAFVCLFVFFFFGFFAFCYFFGPLPRQMEVSRLGGE